MSGRVSQRHSRMHAPSEAGVMRRWYGAGPLHLLAMLAAFVVIGYVALRLFTGHPWAVASWLLGGAVVHDLVLFPLYAVTDAALVLAIRRYPGLQPQGVAWINHLRFPAVISGVLLLVWSPIILRLPPAYPVVTGLRTDPYLGRWAAVAGALFAISAVGYAGRLVRARWRSRTATWHETA